MEQLFCNYSLGRKQAVKSQLGEKVMMTIFHSLHTKKSLLFDD